VATARPRNAAATRAAILVAARERFAADGFERTTMRAIARDVGVDPALVIRYFRTKQALFASAAEFRLELPDLTGVAPERLADALLPEFFAVWERDGTFLALLRAAMTSETAAATMREVFATQVAPAIAPACPDRPQERAGVLGALVLGLATARYALANPAVASMSEADLLSWTRPLIAQIVTGPPG
jgi:AcrR family transcriptional regulator